MVKCIQDIVFGTEYHFAFAVKGWIFNMDITIKAAAAFYTPDGVVADTPKKSKLASYSEVIDKNTYRLRVTSDLRPAGVALKIPVELGVNDTIFMNGFQSATESRELSITGKMNGVQSVSEFVKNKYAALMGGDYAFVPYKNKAGVTHGFSYCYFKHGSNIKLFASLDESVGYTVFKFDAWTSTLRISRDIEGIEKFNDYPAISLFYAEGSEDEVFDLWFSKMQDVEMTHAEKLIGYSTAGLSEINEDVLAQKLLDMKRFPVAPNAFIIDERYCKAGEWLKPDSQRFPIGLRDLVDDVHDCSLTAGISLSPFAVDENSSVASEHSEWLLRSSDGRYVKTKNNLFVLDFCNLEVREYIRECLHTILFMWGFDLVKLNNLYAAAMFPSGGMSRGQKMSEAMKFLRECCGGKLMFADHVPLMSAFGLADYCSVTCDAVSDNLPAYVRSRSFRESPSVKNASSDIVFRRQLDGRAFLSATCTISLDEKEKILDGNLNNAEQNLLCSLAGLFSSALITTDNVASYNQKQKRRFKKMVELGNAQNVRVKKISGKYIVGYKLDDKNYFIKL